MSHSGEPEQQGSVLEPGNALLKRWRLLVGLLAEVVTAVVTLLTPATYTATASFALRLLHRLAFHQHSRDSRVDSLSPAEVSRVSRRSSTRIWQRIAPCLSVFCLAGTGGAELRGGETDVTNDAKPKTS